MGLYWAACRWEGRAWGRLEHWGCRQVARCASTWRALLLRRVPTGPPATPWTTVPKSPYQTSPGVSLSQRLAGYCSPLLSRTPEPCPRRRFLGSGSQWQGLERPRPKISCSETVPGHQELLGVDTDLTPDFGPK